MAGASRAWWLKLNLSAGFETGYPYLHRELFRFLRGADSAFHTSSIFLKDIPFSYGNWKQNHTSEKQCARS